MRIKLTLGPVEKKCIIPINYQYPLSAAIYKILASGSLDYAEWLHQKGYLSPGGKPMKLFVFSKLITIKEGSAEETRVKAFESLFYLTGSKELMQVAYECGIGQRNSMGFGMGKII